MVANYSSPLLLHFPQARFHPHWETESPTDPLHPLLGKEKWCSAPAHRWKHLLMNWYLAKIGVVWKKSPAPASKTKLFITYGWVAKSSFPRDGLNYTCYTLSGLSPVWNDMQAAGGFAALRKVRIYRAVSCKGLLCRNDHFVFTFSSGDKHIMI